MTAGNDERVEVLQTRGARSQIGRDDGFAPLASIGRSLGGTDEGDDGPRGPQRIDRSRQLEILELVFDEHRNTLAGQHGRQAWGFYRIADC